jgi:hypothetical protein
MKPYGKNKYANWCFYRRRNFKRYGRDNDIDGPDHSKKAARRDGKKEIQDQLDSMEEED